MSNFPQVLRVTAVAAIALLITSGCTTPDNPVPGGTITFAIPDLRESGFLGDYSALKLAESPEFAVVGRKIYIEPEADLATYRKILIEPVSFAYLRDGLELTDAQKQRLRQYLDEWLNLKFKDRFQKVPVAGPDTLRVRTAITDVSSPAWAAAPGSDLADAATATVELELADSQTGHRFLAMVDSMNTLRFTLANQDLSEEKQVYLNWFDGLSSQMESGVMETTTPGLEN